MVGFSNSSVPLASDTETHGNCTAAVISTPDIGQFLIYGGLAGMAVMLALMSLVSTGIRFLDPGRPERYWIVASLMTVFNVWAVIFSFLFASTIVFNEGSCFVGYLLTNIASQFFFLHFDLFVLYKTHAISQGDRRVTAASIVLILNRVFWVAYDIDRSYGFWDPQSGSCLYSQHAIAGIGYNSADMIIDAFCTTVCIAFTWNAIGSRYGDVISVLLSENVSRSAIILAVNSVLVYASSHVTDPFELTVAFFTQNLAYVMCLNAELLWFDRRKAVHDRVCSSSISKGPDRSGGHSTNA
ncbi:hypothetical protein CcCBS67573_g00218 [Chytriomyces confervae]|uniref:G-protein coupled receptors family 1 profile domain-containing protein n=1 Tax=Chytriomyces confervae TaxID=246404 RepID=A0A507FQ20_9FUNG|nr:hypothetical protein HDU80_005860 [Chytriomyces hyalinus]TPX78519.1 hypothetical protein CcCBS67573_g00218 [Chytriomyces confervae]